MGQNLTEKFKDAQAEPADRYSGYAGYEQAVADIKSEFFAAYPEYQGYVEIVDLKALEENREAEVRRISKALNIDNVEEQIDGAPLHSGKCFSGFNDEADSIAVVAGWDVHNYPEEVLNHQRVIVSASVVVHELAHAVDVMEGIVEFGYVYTDGKHGQNMDNYVEGYADSFRVAMAVLNGHPDEDIKGLISAYEKEQLVGIMRQYSNSDMLNATYYAALSKRDALDAAGEMPQGGFKYWREAKEIVDKVRADNLYKHENDTQSPGHLSMYSERVTQRAILSEVNHFINDAIEHERPDLLKPGQEDALKQFRIDVRKTASDIALHKDGGTEQEMLVFGLAYRVREHMYGLMKERDFIPFSDRYTSVDDYNMGIGVFGRNGEAKTYPFTKMLGEAVLKYKETGEEFDERLALGYSTVVSRTKEFSELPIEDMDAKSIMGYLENNVEAAEFLADGYRLDIALKEIIDRQSTPQEEALQSPTQSSLGAGR